MEGNCFSQSISNKNCCLKDVCNLPFTEEEDIKLITLMKQYGRD